MAQRAVNAFAQSKGGPSSPPTSTGSNITNIYRVCSQGNEYINTKEDDGKSGMGNTACLAAAGVGLAAAAAAAVGYCAGTSTSGQDRAQAHAPDRAAGRDEIATEELHTSETEETTTTHADGTTTTKKTRKRRREKRAVRRQPRRDEAGEGAGMPQRVPEAEMRRLMTVALMGEA
ncbi:hypothetical protein BBAD15_g9043 [Beauveria bassiana D1-5]|uniref:Uncharacterized protein n=1 Tax=Beauveria bassiana D1-5 TaxID=1245745 RepID=A0A0A2VCX6_BEABA|nr:hypothetical protein BBAD15_g9043 [Beauveria bassiana D1-5]